jgi:hypothetical protein
LNHWAIPPSIAKAKKAAKAEEASTEKHGQQHLGFTTIIGPREFTRAQTLHAVAILIATNNQVSF